MGNRVPSVTVAPIADLRVDVDNGTATLSYTDPVVRNGVIAERLQEFRENGALPWQSMASLVDANWTADRQYRAAVVAHGTPSASLVTAGTPGPSIPTPDYDLNFVLGAVVGVPSLQSQFSQSLQLDGGGLICEGTTLYNADPVGVLDDLIANGLAQTIVVDYSRTNPPSAASNTSPRLWMSGTNNTKIQFGDSGQVVDWFYHGSNYLRHAGPGVVNAPTALAVAWDGDGRSMSVGGAPAVRDETDNVQTTNQSLYFGNQIAGDRPFDGRIRRIRIWNTRLSDADLVALTS